MVLTEENKLPYDRTALSKDVGTSAAKITLRDEAFWKAIDVDVQRERKVCFILELHCSCTICRSVRWT